MTRAPADIADRTDIDALVEGFYRSAFADALIGPIFTDVVQMDLAHHLPVMGDFWETVLFQAGLYRRNALKLHQAVNAKIPLGSEHFARWLQLWGQAVDSRFAGEKAELAKAQATHIAASIQRSLAGRSGSDFETLRVGPAAHGKLTHDADR